MSAWGLLASDFLSILVNICRKLCKEREYASCILRGENLQKHHNVIALATRMGCLRYLDRCWI